jgi:hypothetical protein
LALREAAKSISRRAASGFLVPLRIAAVSISQPPPSFISRPSTGAPLWRTSAAEISAEMPIGNSPAAVSRQGCAPEWT